LYDRLTDWCCCACLPCCLQYAFKNTKAEDLFAALSHEARFDVGKLLDNWVHESGFPIITASKGAGGKLAVSQVQMQAKPTAERPTKTWWVPISVYDGDGETSRVQLQTASTTTDVSVSGFVKLNHGQNGFYRVRYTDSLLYVCTC
jgi:aminopeptidase N